MIVLGEGEVREIREAVEGCVTSGDRYPGVMATVCFADTPELDGGEGRYDVAGEFGKLGRASYDERGGSLQLWRFRQPNLHV